MSREFKEGNIYLVKVIKTCFNGKLSDDPMKVLVLLLIK